MVVLITDTSEISRRNSQERRRNFEIDCDHNYYPVFALLFQ